MMVLIQVRRLSMVFAFGRESSVRMPPTAACLVRRHGVQTNRETDRSGEGGPGAALVVLDTSRRLDNGSTIRHE